MSAPRIHVDPKTFQPWKVQALTHALSDHPLLQIQSLVATIGFFAGGLVATHLLLPLILRGSP